jgi:hypothetical protein
MGFKGSWFFNWVVSSFKKVFLSKVLVLLVAVVLAVLLVMDEIDIYSPFK